MQLHEGRIVSPWLYKYNFFFLNLQGALKKNIADKMD